MTALAQARIDTTDVARSGLVARIRRAIGAMGLNAAVNTIGQLSIVPLALYAWGEGRYGEWVLLTGLATVLKLTDLGLQTFVVNRMCASYAQDDREEMHRVLHSALRIQLPLLAGLLLLLAGAVVLVPVDRVLGLRTVARPELIAVVLLLAIELLISVPMGMIGGFYRATGRLAYAAMIGTVQQLAVITVTLVLLAGGAGFVTLAVARVALAILGSVWITFDLQRLYPWLRLWPDSGAWREGLRMVAPGFFFLLIPVADYLSSQVTLLIVQHTLDGAEVSRLSTHRTLVNVAQMASGLLINAAWPELTMLRARAENVRLAKVCRSLARANVLLVSAAVFGLLSVIQWVYPSWTAGRLALDGWTLAFLVLRTLVWASWNVSFCLLLAINRHERVALVLVGAGALTSALAMVLVPLMGIGGAALAALVAECCVPAWLMPLLASREIGDNPVQFLREASAAPLLGIGIPAGIGLGAWLLLPSPLARYGLVAPVSVLLVLVFVHRLLAPHERRIVNDLCRHLCKIRMTTLSLRGAP